MINTHKIVILNGMKTNKCIVDGFYLKIKTKTSCWFASAILSSKFTSPVEMYPFRDIGIVLNGWEISIVLILLLQKQIHWPKSPRNAPNHACHWERCLGTFKCMIDGQKLKCNKIADFEQKRIRLSKYLSKSGPAEILWSNESFKK